jgi:Domain of unknown function (DUF4145)
MVRLNWQGVREIAGAKNYVCGHCWLHVGGDRGYWPKEADSPHGPSICVCICPNCSKPTYLEPNGLQIPGPLYGENVNHLPPDVGALYREARNCMACFAYTAGAMACRKILMNVAVSQGAAAGLSFKGYVDLLADSGYVPPNGKGWVDHIRDKGNEAVHEIKLTTKEDLADVLTFVAMLLKFVFEFPNRVPKPLPKN